LKRGPESLRSQLHRTLRRAILSGTLPPHAPLPSTRALAQRLGVSRNTVLAAYEALASEGLVVGRAGSGTRVADGAKDAGPTPPALSARRLLRAAHFPRSTVRLRDPDGHVIRLTV
jgi:GntR family transcriptional regulator/MocR family aminotransferase